MTTIFYTPTLNLLFKGVNNMSTAIYFDEEQMLSNMKRGIEDLIEERFQSNQAWSDPDFCQDGSILHRLALLEETVQLQRKTIEQLKKKTNWSHGFDDNGFDIDD